MLSTASTAKSSNVGFLQVVQLFVPATNPAALLVQKKILL